MRKPNGYWTKERCHEEALKYTKRNNFIKNSNNAYEIARRNNWLNDICHHMINKVYKQKGYWTKEKCKEEALKYYTRTTFENNSHSAYRISLRCGWLDDICYHMELQHKPNNYWTKERCHKEALKYNTRTDFQKESNGAYDSALRNLWLDEICYHIIKKGNYKKRCIYVYEFNDNSAYVGLTYYIENRHNRHLNDKNSQVYKHINKTKNYKLIKLTDYINVNNAIKLEKEYVNLYKNNGWNILNKAKTGSIGGNILKWTYDKCKKEALKYNTKSEFIKNNGNGAYSSASKNKWLGEICSHMKSKIIKWTKEDELFLLENYKNKGVNFCMEKLNRNKNAIRSRYYKIQIK